MESVHDQYKIETCYITLPPTEHFLHCILSLSNGQEPRTICVALAYQVLRALDVLSMPHFGHGLEVDAITPQVCLITTVCHSVNLVAAHEVLP